MKTKQFEQLKQLDRIEYLLQHKAIKDNRYNLYGWLADLRIYLEMFGLMMLASLFYDSLTNKHSITLLKGFKLLTILWRPYILIISFAFLLSLIFFFMKLRKLNKQFLERT